MFIQRDKAPKGAENEEEVVDSNQTFLAGTTTSHIPRFTTDEITTYEEKTIKVLSILEKSGVNIYSMSNYPGMYLKTKEGQAEKLSKFFDSPTAVNTEEKEQSNISDLISFFK